LIGSDIPEHKRVEQALRALASRRETDLEDKRRRIAHEMHDELGQKLLVLRMNVTLLRMQFDNEDPRVRDAIARVLALVDPLIQTTRDVAASLRWTKMLSMKSTSNMAADRPLLKKPFVNSLRRVRSVQRLECAVSQAGAVPRWVRSQSVIATT
jgi:hypothetical protein